MGEARAMKNRQELIGEFMEMFQLLSLKVQETDQSCCEIVSTNDITKVDLALIGFIGKEEEVIMRQVAEYLKVPYSTATGIVDKLVNMKFLKRVNSEKDRRTVKVCLTPKKGKEIYSQFLSFRNKLGEIVLSDLDEKDFEDIARIMEKMANKITNYNLDNDLRKLVNQ